MQMKKATLISLMTIILLSNFCLAEPPKAHGAWVYDTLYDEDGNKIGKEPGLFASAINAYNNSATMGHKLTQIFPYGGDIAMYCEGSGGSSSGTECTLSKMSAGYSKDSADAYYNLVHNSANPAEIMPVVDGVVGGYYLKNFNTMSEKTAKLLADMVAKKYCADSNIIGIQFDIEKFDIKQPGQAYFYTQIAKNLAGKNSSDGPDPFKCVDANHPQGRIFSVFAPSGKVNSTLAGILNRYNNGFVAGPLYSLGSTTGSANSPSYYEELITNEVERMVERGKAYNVKYQFGIPVAASIQEFEEYDGEASGYYQIDYVKKVINIINTYARKEPNFLGINWWAFRSKAYSRGKELKPSKPSGTVKTYLASRLK